MDVIIFVGTYAGYVAEVGSVSAIVFGDINCAVTVISFYPDDVAPGTKNAITNRMSDSFT